MERSLGLALHPPLACRPSPPQGGDWQFHRPCSSSNFRRLAKVEITSNLPLEGEMAGRPEGGAALPLDQS
ncbi:MAG: hypothetical protein EOQ92_10890 [Mesorhizobium sp.]|nr:MAG: hypothetical protein EOQ92_10890 [Mesorhizobium sp.]RWK51889.1 MAG: hypothetical protein EOR47_06490 [Mesorhizobium sp.]RWK97223.1 MAG: hypothetical protein EOR53_06130 [Mesorhizobium sp.]TIQ28159.1 MAG: hypothetical protein E5X54_18695 [Mesorhizobium sp.]TIQ83263.1 MAG: hypothetical protein E5X44_28670 [Mesorhizobium sp.]